MRTIKKPKKTAVVHKVGDKVVTSHGEGRVVGAFPSGPHRKATYAVKFPRRRIAVIFAENEVSAIRPAATPVREPG